ncbi:hypothetical protein BV20DRAFT_983757 [Pilatotrama ljubarskyi]|nr:hypothetical protein BV20DRAFT_983757 [Pilatotrama ljubarskyi]
MLSNSDRPAGATRSRKRTTDAPDETARRKQQKTAPTLEVQSAAITGPVRLRSAEFYYPDGNIIVIVGNVEFNLHLSRLIDTCDFFARNWIFDEEPDEETGERRIRVRDGAKGDTDGDESDTGGDENDTDGNDSEADGEESDSDEDKSDTDGDGEGVQIGETDNGTSQDGDICVQRLDDGYRFHVLPSSAREALVRGYAITPPTQPVAIALLRVATRLGCRDVRDLAEHRIEQLWPCTVIHANLSEPKADSDALEIISVCREFKLQGFLKRAFYELVRSTTFWKKVETERHMLALADADLLMLYRARHVLQQLWRELVFVPPPHPCPTGLCQHTSAPQRQASWSAEMVKRGHPRKGEEDPIGYLDTFKRRVFEQLNGTWCKTCLTKSAVAWLEAKREWWRKLNGLFKLD